jgi:DNA repair ATPase RecN
VSNFRWMLGSVVLGCWTLLCLLPVSSTTAHAADTQTASSPAAASAQVPHPGTLTEREQSRLDRNVEALIKAAKIEDEAAAAKTREIMADHFPRLWAWHKEHDAELAELWGQWREARSDPNRDEAKAAGFTDKIAEVYKSFQPQHDRFVEQLSETLTPEQVEAIKNHLTSSPGMMRTYNAYCAIIPEMTDKQKAYILANFKRAREEAMDTDASQEVDNIFKKYKVLNEAYLNEQGYDWKARYKAHFYPPKPADKQPAG